MSEQYRRTTSHRCPKCNLGNQWERVFGNIWQCVACGYTRSSLLGLRGHPTPPADIVSPARPGAATKEVK